MAPAAQQIVVTELASERVRITGALEEPATVRPPPAPGDALSPIFHADSPHHPTVLAALEGVEKTQASARHPIDHVHLLCALPGGIGLRDRLCQAPGRRHAAPTHTRPRDAQRLGSEPAMNEESHGLQASNRSPLRRARSAGSSTSHTASSHATSRPIVRSRVRASTSLVPQGTSAKSARQGALNPTRP